MRVRFSQALVISEYFNYDRFGEMILAQPLAADLRPYTPTAVEVPGSPEFETRLVQNRLSRITLDDGFTSQNPELNRYPNGEQFSLLNRFRGGDIVANVTGILDERFGLYRVQPLAGADYHAQNPRPMTPPSVGGFHQGGFV